MSGGIAAGVHSGTCNYDIRQCKMIYGCSYMASMRAALFLQVLLIYEVLETAKHRSQRYFSRRCFSRRCFSRIYTFFREVTWMWRLPRIWFVTCYERAVIYGLLKLFCLRKWANKVGGILRVRMNDTSQLK